MVRITHLLILTLFTRSGDTLHADWNAISKYGSFKWVMKLIPAPVRKYTNITHTIKLYNTNKKQYKSNNKKRIKNQSYRKGRGGGKLSIPNEMPSWVLARRGLFDLHVVVVVRQITRRYREHGKQITYRPNPNGCGWVDRSVEVERGCNVRVQEKKDTNKSTKTNN